MNLQEKKEEIQKEKLFKKEQKWGLIQKIIMNYNDFKNFLIVRGYKNFIFNEINEDLISIDNERRILNMKVFFENSNNSYNKIPISINNQYNKMPTNQIDLINKTENNIFEKICLKFSYIISLFNNQLEEAPLIADAKEENKFINDELENIFDAYFDHILLNSKKNIILNYINHIFEERTLGPNFININLLENIGIFIKLINKNVTKIINENDLFSKKLIENKFDFYINIISKDNIRKEFESKGISASNYLNFEINEFVIQFEEKYAQDKDIIESTSGIQLKVVNLNNDSQLNLVFCNTKNKEFTMNILKRSKMQNPKKIKKEAFLNNMNNITLNTEKSITTINNQRTLNTTISGLDNFLEEIEIKNTSFSNIFITFVDIKANFDFEERSSLYRDEDTEETRYRLDKEFYKKIENPLNQIKEFGYFSIFQNSLIKNKKQINYSKENVNYNIDGKMIKEMKKYFV